MPRFAANISTMFTDRPFAARIQAAAAAGFAAVECQFPYEVPAGELERRLAEAGVELILLNTPPGDFAAGERGLAGLPGREAEFRAGLESDLHEYLSDQGGLTSGEREGLIEVMESHGMSGPTSMM